MFCMVYLCSYVLYVFVVGGDGASYVLYGLLVQLCLVCFLCVCASYVLYGLFCTATYCTVYLCSYVLCGLFVQICILLFICTAMYCVVYLYSYVLCGEDEHVCTEYA